MADTPRLTVLCVYPDMSSPPSEVSFRLSPSYGLLTARSAHDWFLEMMRQHEDLRAALEAFRAIARELEPAGDGAA